MPYVGARGSLHWIAMQHLVTPFWAMKDEVELLSLIHKFVEHMDVLFALFGLPLLAVFINEMGRRQTSTTRSAEKLGNFSDFSNELKTKQVFSARAAILLVALFVLPAASIAAAGGIGLPKPEPTLYTIRIFVVRKNLAQGETISTDDVRLSELSPCLDPDPKQFLQTSPVGRKAKYELLRGQIFCVNDVCSTSSSIKLIE